MQNFKPAVSEGSKNPVLQFLSTLKKQGSSNPRLASTRIVFRCAFAILATHIHSVEEPYMSEASTGIESSMQEHRLFPPPESISKNAWIKSRAEYDKLYRESIDSPETFWGRIANELHWFKKWDKVLD